MATEKVIKYGEESRNNILKGADIIADAVQVTLGPLGRNVILERTFGTSHVTKDGVTVAREVSVKDPLVNVGIQVVRDAATKTNNESGDGTTTSIVLARKMINDGMKKVSNGSDPVQLSRGMKAGADLAVKYIQEHLSQEIGFDLNKIEQVAIISSNNDEFVGKKVKEAVEMSGKDGIVTFENSNTYDTYVEKVEGIKMNRGLISHIFLTSVKNNKPVAEFEKPVFIIADETLSNMSEDLGRVMTGAAALGRPIIIVARDVTGSALNTLLMNKMQNGFQVAAVKAPGFGGTQSESLMDLAASVGAKVVSSDLNMGFDKFERDWIGEADKAIISMDDTVIIGGNIRKEEVEERLKTLEARMKSEKHDSSAYKALEDRKQLLQANVAVIRIGAESEIAQMEVKDRMDDALSAVRAAIDKGISPGGGVSLILTSKYLNEWVNKVNGSKAKKAFTTSFIDGVKVIADSLLEPFNVICNNAGIAPETKIDSIKSKKGKFFGYNFATDKVEDMISCGVIDPTKVLICAVNNSSSIASTVVTTECIISNEPEKEKNN